MANDYERWRHYSRLELVEEIERLEAAALAAAAAADGRTPETSAFWVNLHGPAIKEKYQTARSAVMHGAAWFGFGGPDGLSADEALSYAGDFFRALDELPSDGRTPDDPSETSPDLLALLITAASHVHAETGRMPYLVDLDDPKTVEQIARALYVEVMGRHYAESVANGREVGEGYYKKARAVVAALKDGAANG